VLDDPKRYVSRLHALVARNEGGYVLTVASKVNFVVVNGQRHGPNSTVPVRPGDKLEIGRYVLEVLNSTSEAAAHGEKTVTIDSREVNTAPMHKKRASEAAGERVAAAKPAGRPVGKGLIASLAGDPDIDASLPGSTAGSSAPEHSGTQLLSAFFEAVGVAPGTMQAGDGERHMREAGALLRVSTEGLISLLAARAAMTKDIRAQDRTTAAARDSNPLKLMSDPQQALAFLFEPRPPEGDVLSPVEAVKDACEELRAHETALIAAMRAAIMGAIERLDPAKLQEALEKTRGTVRFNRKGALWDLFVEQHAGLARDAEEDLNRTFAREFLGTYMTQVQRLRGKR
jgi:predicted component of type VI protein secretion system